MDKYTVRDSSGAVDVEASAVAYAEALVKWVDENELSKESLDTAVHAVFDRFRGQTILMPALLSAATLELNDDPSSHKENSKRLHRHIQGLRDSGVLKIVKGKGGGVVRVSDLPQEESEVLTSENNSSEE